MGQLVALVPLLPLSQPSRRMSLIREEASLPSLHATDPSLDVLPLPLYIFFDFRMRKNMEALFPHRIDADLSHVRRFERSVTTRNRERAAAGDPFLIRAVLFNIRLHRLRTQHRNANALMAMCDRNPLRKGDRRSLRHCIMKRAEL